MSLFSTDTITRFAQEGESDFCSEKPCIIKRVALTIVSGTATYTLSDDVLSIRRIAWKGQKLDPLPQRAAREIFQGASQSGTPFWYIFNNIGQNKIQFFPAPVVNIATTASNLYGSEIANRVIVEYWQAPDYTTAIIPSYMRRRLLKAYVLKSCFAIEGAGQNLKNVGYFEDKYRNLKRLYTQLLEDLHGKPRKLSLNNYSGTGYFPGQPILPMARFGQSVETGE